MKEGRMEEGWRLKCTGILYPMVRVFKGWEGEDLLNNIRKT
jgi:hypothetical protein